MIDPGIQIRPAGPADLDTIIRFNTALAAETEAKSLDPVVIREGVRQALADSARCLYFVAESQGTVCGQTMVTFERSDWRNGFFWWIQSVYVDARFRRRGVFQALHAHIRNLAKAAGGVCGLRLYVHRENHRAIQTYQRLAMPVAPYFLCEEDWSTPM